MTDQPWFIRFGRAVAKGIARQYPRSIAAQQPDVASFVDEAIESAWRERGVRGIAAVIGRVSVDVVLARWRGPALPISDWRAGPRMIGVARRTSMWSAFAADARYALRRLRQAPGFTIVALLTLALGIGSTTAMFTVADDVLLKPLPYGAADRLVAIQENVPKFASIAPELPVNAYDFSHWRSESHAFDALSLITGTGGILSTGGEPVFVYGGYVSGTFFTMLGLHAELGRLLVPADEQPGHDDVVVISHALWVDRLGGDPTVVGRPLTIGNHAFTVVGVLPAGVKVPRQSEVQSPAFGDNSADFWRPFVIEASDLIVMSEFDFGCIGLLKPGVSVAQARADLERIEDHIAQSAGPNESLHPIVRPLQTQAGARAHDGLVVLLGAVTAVLLIVCVNLSNLVLSRAVGRQREFAVRAALGASTRRLAALMLTETLLVATIGSALGFAAAGWAVHAILLTAPLGLPDLSPIGIDARAWTFVSLLTVVTALLVGALPARRLSRRTSRAALGDNARSVGETLAGGRTSRMLVAGEVALAAMTLVVAGLLLGSFARLMGVDKGFVPDRALVVSAGISGSREAQIAFDRRVLDTIRALPGVATVGLTNKLPISGEGSNTGLHAADGAMGPNDWPTVDYRCVSPDYFQAIGIPLVRGRLFRDSDGDHPVALISVQAASRIWPGRDPVGHSFRLEGFDVPIEVVGVVGDVHGASLQKAPSPTIYQPFWQQFRSGYFVVRTAGDPALVAAELPRALHALEPEAPMPRVRAMADLVDASVAQRQFQLEVVVFFALVGVLLAALGVYGVLAQSVARRTREIGVRMALGASRADVWRLITRQGLAPVAMGLVVGLAGAVAAGRILRGLLFGVTITEPRTFAAVTVAVAASSLVACYLPARRAARVDPTIALRAD